VDYNKNGKRMQAREFKASAAYFGLTALDIWVTMPMDFLHAAAQNVPDETLQRSYETSPSI
jgi:hypothetical protein